jgi:hypothetical protein
MLILFFIGTFLRLCDCRSSTLAASREKELHAAGQEGGMLESWRTMSIGRPATRTQKESAGSAHAPALPVCQKDTTHMHDARGLLGGKQKVRSRKLPRGWLIYRSSPAACLRSSYCDSSDRLGPPKIFHHPSRCTAPSQRLNVRRRLEERVLLLHIFSCKIYTDIMVWIFVGQAIM